MLRVISNQYGGSKMSKATQLLTIPLGMIRENPDALRAVDKESENFLGLVDSIKQKGVLNAISVREVVAPSGAKEYALIDGLHRFHAAIAAALTEIPAQVFSLDQAEVYEAQIEANVHKVETKHMDYCKAVQ